MSLFVRASALAAALFVAAGSAAQPAPPASPRFDLLPARGIARNFAAPLHAEGATLWGGPLLSITRDGGATWARADADSLTRGDARVFSLDVEGPVVWAGLYGTVTDRGIDGAGFLTSADDGATFTAVGQPVDRPRDSVEVVFGSRLRAYLNGDGTDAAARDVDFDPATGTTYAALGFAGLRRTTDGGRTWHRVVLPPDNLDELRPDATYAFLVGPKTLGFAGNDNHYAVSVLVDEAGTVWAGTPRGVNRSDDGGTAWRRTEADGSPGSLTGSYVAVIEEQPLPGRNPVWLVTRNSPDIQEQARDGLTVTRDGGATFTQALVGETLFDVAFRGTTVYAAGLRGLFTSADGGASWRLLRDLCDPTQPCVPGLPVYAVAVTSDGAVWAGTTDGAFRSLDGGATWRQFRAEVPLRPAADEPGRAADTYAYPNPFSPSADRSVRLRYDARGAASVRVRIFDFGMQLVRTLDGPGGAAEVEAIWDGFDGDGLRVPNGPYFYAVEAGGRTVRGKLLVIE